MLTIVLRHVFNFISAILFSMHNNDVELRLPCQEGALGKASKLALDGKMETMQKKEKETCHSKDRNYPN